MDQLRRLITEAARDYSHRRPLQRNCTHSWRIRSTSCGDEIEVFLHCVEGRIHSLSADMRSCLVCSAAWTLLARWSESLSINQCLEESRRILDFFDGDSVSNISFPDLFFLASFQKPSPRRECVKLPFLALVRALSAEAAK